MKRKESLLFKVYRFVSLFTAISMMIPMLALAEKNNPPEVNVGDDKKMIFGGTVLLYGEAYDPDGDLIIVWTWKIEKAPDGSSARLSTPNREYTRFTPDLIGEYVISVLISDGIADSKPDSLTVTVVDDL